MVDVRCSRVTWTNTVSASTADAHPTSSSPGWPALLPFRLLLTKADMHILVFPEFSYVPFVEAFYSADIRFSDSIQYLYDRVLELSRYLGRAVVICNEDKQGAIVCIYANSFAEETETKCKHYLSGGNGQSRPAECPVRPNGPGRG